MAPMHAGANVEVAHQFPVSLKQGGLLLLQKCQFRLARKVFFIWERPQRQSEYFPHLVQSHVQFANRGEEGPCSRAVQLKDGVEIHYAHLNVIQVALTAS